MRCKLVDAKGAVLFELTEVENGMYETTPSHTRYFLQTLAAINKDRITDDLFGDWQITRGPGRAICALNLGNTAYDTDSVVVTLQPGCDASITRFAPVAWKLDRGQFVMIGGGGQAWRFEENEANIWSRIPRGAPAGADGAASNSAGAGSSTRAGDGCRVDVRQNRDEPEPGCRESPSSPRTGPIRLMKPRGSAPTGWRRGSAPAPSTTSPSGRTMSRTDRAD